MSIQTLIIHSRLPGLNAYTKNARGNKYKSNKEKQFFTELIAINCKSQKINKLKSRADFKITWYEKDKRRDKDNIMFAQKYIFDGLQVANIIKNDGWNEIGDITHKFYIDKQNPRVEIEITEITEIK